jgi:phage terminase large subunit-like protein
MRANLIERLRGATSLPVEHVVVDIDEPAGTVSAAGI